MGKDRLRKLALLIAGCTMGVTILLLLVASPLSSAPGAPLGSPEALPTPAPGAAPSSTQPEITWSATSTEIILPPGETTVQDLSFTSSASLQNIVLRPVPEIAPFLAIQPASFPSVAAGQPEGVHITFSIPPGATFGSYAGTVHVQNGTSTLPQTLKVTIVVTKQGVILVPPAGYTINSRVAPLGGPVSLNNFGSAFQEGGVIPLGGSEIDITSIPLPSMPLQIFIARELQGATISATKQITVSGDSCTEESYSEVFTPTLTYGNISVYCPHGEILYKLYLSYQAGDPLENQFLASFQNILDTIRFAP